MDPAGAGLPQQAISRVQVNVNGQVVSVDDIRWQETEGGIEGRLDYGPDRYRRRVMLRPGPAAVVVVVADGSGELSAQQAWHFVVQSAPDVQLSGGAGLVPDRGGPDDAGPATRAARFGPWRAASLDRGRRSAGPGDHLKRSPRRKAPRARPASAQAGRACAWTSAPSRIFRPATCA